MSVGMVNPFDQLVRAETDRVLRYFLERDPYDLTVQVNREEWERAVKGQRGDQVRRD